MSSNHDLLQTSASLGGRFALKRDPGCAPLEDQKFSNVERVDIGDESNL
jgi:hypothetical protein